MDRSWRQDAAALRAALEGGLAVTPAQIPQWTARWLGCCKPRGSDTEDLEVLDVKGHSLEPAVTAPRWLCHLLGLPHASVHVLLTWKSPRLGPCWVCQVRSWDKADFPGRVDVSVGGHCVAGHDAERTAWTELQQELGLTAAGLSGEGLSRVARYASRVEQPEREYYDREWCTVFQGRLLSLDALAFPDGEVQAVTLCPCRSGAQLIAQEHLPVSPGLARSLPLCRVDEG